MTDKRHIRVCRFIAFVVYRVFHHNDRRHAMIDTYYSIHKLILLVKPLLPKDSNDASPLEYVDALTASVLLDVLKHDHALYDALKTKDVVKITILKGVSTLFLNWFSRSQGIDLLDFIVHTTKGCVPSKLLLSSTAKNYYRHQTVPQGCESPKGWFSEDST